MLLLECPILWGRVVVVPTGDCVIYNPFSDSLKMPLPHSSMWDYRH